MIQKGDREKVRVEVRVALIIVNRKEVDEYDEWAFKSLGMKSSDALNHSIDLSFVK